MKRFISIMIIVFLISTMFTSISFADNPIVQTVYTADPAPIVYNDILYLYTGNDLDIATTSYKMTDYKCYSTKDMVNWTDHGTVLDVSAFSWARHDQDANAAQVIYNPKTNKFYYYVSVSCTLPGKGGIAIGVAVSDSPTGPFTDAIGGPLVTNDMTKYASHSWDDLDPTVFIDDDGQAYLYWGNNACYYAKLNEDMISLDGPITALDITDTTAFGPDYEEAPWLYKRNGLYYLAYAAGFPEHLAYSTSTSPTGPWTYRGVLMQREGNSSTNHPGIIDYKGNSYLFYQNDWLPGGDSYHRSVCVEKFEYNPDGTIPTIGMTREGAPQIEYLDPYVRTEAETICWSSGIKTEPCSEGGMNICSVDDGDYIKVKGVDFGAEGAGTFTASVASDTNGGTIELRLDSVDGTLIGTLPVSHTGGENNWKTETTNISGAAGVHDLYLVFRGSPDGNLFKADYWQFERKSDIRELAAINATIDKYKIDTVSGVNTAQMKVIAIYTDGTSEDVTSQAVAIPAQSGIVEISDGVVTGLAFGSTSISVSYGGKTDVLYVSVTDLRSQLTPKNLTVNKNPVFLNIGRTTSFKVTAEYIDGHFEDVTAKATYFNPHPEIAEVSNGTITARSLGTTNVVISYKGEMGDAVTTEIIITVGQAPLGGGNVAWYEFDEPGGEVAIDSSGRGNDATIIGATGARVAGRFGNALRLQSSGSQYVRLPNGIVSDLDDFTIATWINPSTMATWARIFDFGNGTNTNMFLTLRASSNNQPRFAIRVNGSSEQQLTAGSGFTLSANTWYHIAITKSGNTAKMYLNGRLAATNNNMTFNPSDMGITTNNWIGRSQYSADPYLNGIVDEFSIYDYALSEEEIKALTIIDIPVVKITTEAGVAPVLPDIVTVNYQDGTSGTATVTWEEIDPALYASEGVFTVVGTVPGAALTATAEVTVNPAAGPSAIISAAGSVQPKAAFTVGISLDNVSSEVYAEDIILSYDANVFEYMGAVGANDNIKVLREDVSVPGTVRLIAANIGGVSGTSTPILNIDFKVKAGAENTTGIIAVTSAKLGTADASIIEAGLSSKVISIGGGTPGVDKSGLIAAINNAQSLYDAAVVGTQPGQYPQAAKEMLKAAIDAAKEVRDDPGATQSQVDSAVTALSNAIDIFMAAVVEEATPDINEDGIIDVADLAFVAYYYGKECTGTEWLVAKAADMNGDGKIDIEDLAYVAIRIED